MKTKNSASRFRFFKCLGFALSLTASQLYGQTYEGVDLFSNTGDIYYDWLPQFLPYNPVIIEAGAFRGDQTRDAAKVWPQARIFAFEPSPYSYYYLEKMVAEEKLGNVETINAALNTFNGTAKLFVCHGINGQDPAFEYASSLLPLKNEMKTCCKGPTVKVPCFILDDWCAENQIDHVDILRLDVGGLELQVLESSPHILSTVKIVWVQTMMHPYRVSMTEYDHLKRYLEAANFVLLSHWYTAGIKGHALFLSRELFDAYFKKSLGIYLGA